MDLQEFLKFVPVYNDEQNNSIKQEFARLSGKLAII